MTREEMIDEAVRDAIASPPSVSAELVTWVRFFFKRIETRERYVWRWSASERCVYRSDSCNVC